VLVVQMRFAHFHKILLDVGKRPLLTEIPQQNLDLRRMNDTIVRKAILAVERINSSTTIAIAYGDGSIEFRDRVSMTPITPNEDFNRVSSMPQAGFTFPTDDLCKLRRSVSLT
jgi:mediator of RNA polymerase II transcription subunit 16